MLVLEHVVCEILVTVVGDILLNRRIVFRFVTSHFVEKSLHRMTMLSSTLRVKGDTIINPILRQQVQTCVHRIYKSDAHFFHVNNQPVHPLDFPLCLTC